jgi:hypothetical protein
MKWLVIVMALLASCKSVEVVEVVKTETLHSGTVRIDSVRILDSVYVDTYSKGDTVYLEKTKVVYRDRIKIVHDTLYLSEEKTKEIPIPTERKPSIWESISAMLKEARWLIITAVVAYIAYIFYRRKTPHN